MFQKIYDLFSTGVLYEILLTIILIIVFMVVKKVISRLITKRAEAHKFDHTRILYVKNASNIGLWIIFFILLAFVWNISFKGLSIYAASLFTVVGVGLFANWSIISNVTASVILFFFFPFKIGSRVKIKDGENSVEGLVIKLSLFSVHIEQDDGNEVYFPNNLVIQKSIIDLKKESNQV